MEKIFFILLRKIKIKWMQTSGNIELIKSSREDGKILGTLCNSSEIWDCRTQIHYIN